LIDVPVWPTRLLVDYRLCEAAINIHPKRPESFDVLLLAVLTRLVFGDTEKDIATLRNIPLRIAVYLFPSSYKFLPYVTLTLDTEYGKPTISWLHDTQKVYVIHCIVHYHRQCLLVDLSC
jgi:hypothetical protein